MENTASASLSLSLSVIEEDVRLVLERALSSKSYQNGCSSECLCLLSSLKELDQAFRAIESSFASVYCQVQDLEKKIASYKDKWQTM